MTMVSEIADKNDCVCFQQSCSFRSTAKIQHSSTLMALRQWRLPLGTSSEYQWIAFTKGQWCEKHDICIRICIFPSVKHHGLFCRLMTRPWYQFSFREVDNNWRVVGDRFNYKIISATQKLLENAFENAVCEMAAICPGIWVNIALVYSVASWRDHDISSRSEKWIIIGVWWVIDLIIK